MDKLFSVFGDINHTKLGGGDSFTDQLNCKYTVYILSLVAILSTTRVFVDEPISCYCPSQFTSNQVEYTKKVCWVTNTHYVPTEQTHIPKVIDSSSYISYYQWIPLFLAFQAVLFYLPRSMWKKLSRKSGISVSNVTDACIDCQRKADNEGSEKTMRFLTRYMGRFLIEFNKSYSSKKKCSFFLSLTKGNFLVETYIFIKVLYVVNVIGQLFILNAFLGNEYHMYGIDVMKKVFSGEPWNTSQRFPRVTICDFHIRVLGNVHRHTVQCVLPMNLFYEIIFIFLWFWLVFVATATLGSLVFWLKTCIVMAVQEKYVKQRLLAMEKVDKSQKGQVSSFVREHLRRDGCFIIRMAAKNSSDLIASELLCGLWEHYKSVLAKNNNSGCDSCTSMSGDDYNTKARKREEAAIVADEIRKF